MSEPAKEEGDQILDQGIETGISGLTTETNRIRHQRGDCQRNRRPPEGLCGYLRPLWFVFRGLSFLPVSRKGPALLSGGQGQTDPVGDAQKKGQGRAGVHKKGGHHCPHGMQSVQTLCPVLPFWDRYRLSHAGGETDHSQTGGHPALYPGYGPQPFRDHEPDVGQR